MQKLAIISQAIIKSIVFKIEVVFVWSTVVSLFECKPIWAFYVNKFYVYNV